MRFQEDIVRAFDIYKSAVLGPVSTRPGVAYLTNPQDWEIRK
jgi:hypothetical protein